MKIDISTKNITLDEPLKVFIEDKIGGLDHLIGNNDGQAKVEIGMPSKHHRSGDIFSAEVNAIVDVKDELQIQIKKFKEKRTDLERQPKE